MNRSKQGLVGLAPRRTAAGYTQETFADALGVTRSLLAAWEAGRVWPSARWLPEMAALVHCPVEALFTTPDTTIIPEMEGDDHAGVMQEFVL